MKPWQVVVLVYLTASVVGYELGIRKLPVEADVVAAALITLLGLAWIRLLKKSHNPNK